MAVITPQAGSVRTGVTPAAASAGGDTLAMGSAQRCILNVVNASGSAITVTLTAVQTCSEGFLHNVTVTCAANKTTPIGVAQNDGATQNCIDQNGNVAITYSATTSVTVYAVTA